MKIEIIEGNEVSEDYSLTSRLPLTIHILFFITLFTGYLRFKWI